MDLVLDVGNTRAKAGLFQAAKLHAQFQFAHDRIPKKVVSGRINNLLYASVIKEDIPALHEITCAGKKLRLTHKLPLPIVNRYSTPATLGPDRLAAACGASLLFPRRPCLIIDAGTCITSDFVSAKGEFFGGSISPGIGIRFQSLHALTAKLPLVPPAKVDVVTGKTTRSCIQSGVQNGALFELQGFIGWYRNRYPDLQIVLTGGDAPFFEKYLKAGIFVVPNLVLIGLNQILQHNVSR